MGLRDRSSQFRQLVRVSLADLFDQRKPFGRLALTHVLMTAGDTMFAVSLAGSLFFSISPTAARGKVLLYLLLTMAPFAVVAPALGPVIDRSRGARRAMVVISALARAVLCLVVAAGIHSLLLFPEAFAMLVLSKVYLVTKGALVPEMAAQGLLGPVRVALGRAHPYRSGITDRDTGPPARGTPASLTADTDAPDLAALNARLGLLASLSGFVFALPAIAALSLGGASWVLRLACIVFACATVAGIRLPVRRSARAVSALGEEPGRSADRAPTGWDELDGPGGAVAEGQRAGTTVRDEEEADLAVFRPVADQNVLLALVPMSALKAISGFLTFLFAFGLRREGAATWWFGLLLGAVTAGALAGVLLVPRIRRRWSEEQILTGALWLVTAVAVIGAVWPARLVQAVVALGVGVAGAVAKPSFDALVQRWVPTRNQGRAFARFETRLQLVWVVGAFATVVLTLPIAGGDVVMAVFAGVVATWYLRGRRTVRRTAPVRV